MLPVLFNYLFLFITTSGAACGVALAPSKIQTAKYLAVEAYRDLLKLQIA